MVLSRCNFRGENNWGQGFSSFDLCCFIDPFRIAGGYETKLAQDSFFIHWLTGLSFDSALSLHLKNILKKKSKLEETILEYPDLFFTLSPTGAFILWGVQVLLS
jgi:hypothetical protein